MTYSIYVRSRATRRLSLLRQCKQPSSDQFVIDNTQISIMSRWQMKVNVRNSYTCTMIYFPFLLWLLQKQEQCCMAYSYLRTYMI